MKRILFGIVACGACLMLATGCSSDDKDPVLPEFNMSPAEKVIAQKQTSKQAEMLADVVSSQKDFTNDGSNLIFSPINVSMALSVLANATDDNTAAVLTDIVGCSDLDDLNKFNARLIEYLPAQPKNNVLELANGVWYKNDLEIVPSFVKVTSSFYDCMPNKMDFGAPDACKIINNWISDRTHGLINNFVDELTINSMTQMFIASTLYYRGTWLSPFDSKNTTDKAFHGSKGDAKVKMMYKSGTMNYAETADGTQVIELPFKSKNITFSVLLPAEGVDVMDYASMFDSRKLNEIESSIKSSEVYLHLPKFTVTDNLMLDQYLLDKGIDIDRFSVERACSRVNLSLNVKHQTHFEIDEEGVKLAAVTGGAISTAPAPTVPVEFNVDRPFIFLVKEKSTGSILMAGIIRNIEK